jgi:hypothetical protein
MKPKGLVEAASIGQLVDEGDVDGAEDVLQELGQLGRLGVGEEDHVVADLRVEGFGALGAGRREAADELGGGLDRVVGAARVDPLRGEGEVEVAAGGHP